MEASVSGKTYTIGELSARSGVPVRRIRFYSDRGLLPPAGRTDAGYRVYSDADLARLDLIRALREAGLSLNTIRKVLSQRLTLTEVLRMRLATLEAEIASRRRIAALLRATLKVRNPTERDLRRLWAMTNASKEELRQTIVSLFDKVCDGGTHMDDAWKAQVLDLGAPSLPDNATPAQIDAWNELIKIVTDEASVDEMRAEMALMWNDDLDPSAYSKASSEILAKARKAMEAGEQPTSRIGVAIAKEWMNKVAKILKHEPDSMFIEWARKHHARSSRYRKLLAILHGNEEQGSFDRAWLWVDASMKSLLESAA